MAPQRPAQRAPEAFAEKVALPAVGEALAPRIAVQARPISKAPVRAVMKAFLLFDYRPTVFFAIDRRETGQGSGSKSGSPAARTVAPAGSGFADSSAAERRAIRIVIDRSQRRLRLYRHKRMAMKTKVVVGTPDAPTPLGHFYLTAGFVPGDDFLGPGPPETSAYAAITDWPRGGSSSCTGTSETCVSARASHGCLRVYNR